MASADDGSTTAVVGPGSVPRVRGNETPASPGSTLGRYVVLEEIGRGGMGRVLRAYDPKLQREVALKTVRRRRLGREGLSRLQAEARAMAKLSHPNVVAVYDVEQTSDGASPEVALVMEYVAGCSMKAWLATGERPWRDVLGLFIEAGRGLAAAHAAGLLHRDFKPANVMLDVDAALRIVKVTDFGLAKIAGSPDSSSSSVSMMDTSDGSLTEAGTVMGTPRYMAPEQHRGDELTPAADQYSFCVSLWEALCGEVPFLDDDPAVAKLGPLPAWTNSAVPRSVADAIRRGLSAGPHRRWPAMDDLLAALDYDSGGRRRRLSWGALVVVAIGSTGLGYGAWVSSTSARCSGSAQQLWGVWDDDRRAEVKSAFLEVDARFASNVWTATELRLDAYAESWAAMHTEACEATTVRGEQSAAVMDLRMACLHRAKVDFEAVTRVLADADSQVVGRAHNLVSGLPPVGACEDLDALRSGVEPPAPEDVDTVAEVRRLVADAKALIAAGRYEAAAEPLQQAQHLVGTIDYGPVQTEVLLTKGLNLERLGRYEEAVDVLDEGLGSSVRWSQRVEMAQVAMRLLSVLGDKLHRVDEAMRYRTLAEGLAGEHPSLRPQIIDIIGLVLRAQGSFEEAATTHRIALSHKREVFDADDPRIANSHNNLALALQELGRHEEAEGEYRASLEILERTLGPDHPSTATSRNNLGNALLGQGRAADAVPIYQEVLRTRIDALGSNHVLVARTRLNHAAALAQLGKLSEAKQEHQRAVRELVEAIGTEHPTVALARLNLAYMLHHEGELDGAERELRAALATMVAARGADHPDIAQFHSNLSSVLFDAGRYEEAEREARAAVQLREKSLGADDSKTAESRHNLAFALRGQGRLEESEREHRAALTAWSATLDADSERLANSRVELADLLGELGRPAEALPLAELAWVTASREDASPELQGKAAFVMAQLVLSTASKDDQRRRARHLAERAVESFERAGPDHAEDASEARGWLRHGGEALGGSALQ